MLAHVELLRLFVRVSIHTRHCCRVMRWLNDQLNRIGVFQSTPGIAAG